MKTRIVIPGNLAALILLTASALAFQDMTSNSRMPIRDPGNGTISGRVMMPSGMMNGSNLKIILSNTQAPMITLYSDKNGEFNFNNLRSSVYFVQVLSPDGKYEPLMQKVLLRPGEPVYLTFYLKEKLAPGARESSGNIVSASEAQTVPDAARKAFDSARKLIDKGEIDRAILELNKAIAIYPDYMVARNNLGVQYLKRRRLDEAADQFKIILEKDSKNYNARLNFGIVLVEQKRYREAVEELSRASALDSSQPAAHLFLGIAALDMNDLEVAERELVKALLLGGPQYSNAHYYFAHVYLKTGRREQAAHELDLFLKTARPGEMATQARALLQQLGGKQ